VSSFLTAHQHIVGYWIGATRSHMSSIAVWP